MSNLSAVLTCVLVLGLTVSASATSQFSNNIQDIINEKNANLSGNVPNPPEILVGGETCANATPIGVPGFSSGTTCDNVNDYDEACPYTGSTSGDEVYVISGLDVSRLTIDLCNSSYDTKIYVYEGSCPGTLIACNDDACNDPSGNPYRSRIDCLTILAERTYYVVVDGYFGDCGSYTISTYGRTVGCFPDCELPDGCPPYMPFEGEPVCFDGYVDTYDAGCNSAPPSFVNLACADELSLCGTAGTYMLSGLSYRDTDWYQIDVGPVACNVTATLCASFDSQLAIIDGDVGCGFITITCGSVFAPAYFAASCGPVAMDGLAWVFAAPSAFEEVPCGSWYILTVDTGDCCPSNSSESKTWGQIKGLFR